MVANRTALKRLNEMSIDMQAAQQLGVRIFNDQGSEEDKSELKKIGEEIISSTKAWMDLIPK